MLSDDADDNDVNTVPEGDCQTVVIPICFVQVEWTKPSSTIHVNHHELWESNITD